MNKPFATMDTMDTKAVKVNSFVPLVSFVVTVLAVVYV